MLQKFCTMGEPDILAEGKITGQPAVIGEGPVDGDRSHRILIAKVGDVLIDKAVQQGQPGEDRRSASH